VALLPQNKQIWTQGSTPAFQNRGIVEQLWLSCCISRPAPSQHWMKEGLGFKGLGNLCESCRSCHERASLAVRLYRENEPTSQSKHRLVTQGLGHPKGTGGVQTRLTGIHYVSSQLHACLPIRPANSCSLHRYATHMPTWLRKSEKFHPKIFNEVNSTL
jgi:hypothetical protein